MSIRIFNDKNLVRFPVPWTISASQVVGSDPSTELLQRVLHKNPATTVVVIDEVDTDNWGIGGEQVTKRRERGE
jgi:hypothetical protein